MWKKDNPGNEAHHSEKAAPAKRNAAGLMGVQASMPGGSPSQQSASTPRQGFSVTDIESVQSQDQEGGAIQSAVSTPGYAFQPASSGPPSAAGSKSGGPDDSWQGLITFQGQGWEYFKLLFVNMLLTIVTLGVYAFWGKTKVRRYLWGSSTLFGQPLEYTGTGKELFISFLIVMPFFLGAMFLFQQLMIHTMHTPYFALVFLLFYVLLFYLMLFASYRALRYRLTRTRWRGIRGNLSGSASKYALVGMGFLFLTLITLGLASPWMTAKLTRMQLNNVWFGNRRLQFDGGAKELVKSFLVMFAGFVVLGAVCGVILFAGMPANTDQIGYDPGGFVISIILVYIIMIFGSVLCAAYYTDTVYRWLFGHMAFGKVTTRSRITGITVLKLYAVNSLIVLFTLGLGYAWAHMRSMRTFLHRIDYKGDPALDSLLQDTQNAPTHGDGLLAALDMAIGF